MNPFSFGLVKDNSVGLINEVWLEVLHWIQHPLDRHHFKLVCKYWYQLFWAKKCTWAKDPNDSVYRRIRFDFIRCVLKPNQLVLSRVSSDFQFHDNDLSDTAIALVTNKVTQKLGEIWSTPFFYPNDQDRFCFTLSTSNHIGSRVHGPVLLSDRDWNVFIKKVTPELVTRIEEHQKKQPPDTLFVDYFHDNKYMAIIEMEGFVTLRTLFRKEKQKLPYFEFTPELKAFCIEAQKAIQTREYSNLFIHQPITEEKYPFQLYLLIDEFSVCLTSIEWDSRTPNFFSVTLKYPQAKEFQSWEDTQIVNERREIVTTIPRQDNVFGLMHSILEYTLKLFQNQCPLESRIYKYYKHFNTEDARLVSEFQRFNHLVADDKLLMKMELPYILKVVQGLTQFIRD